MADPAAISAAEYARARIETAYKMALYRPRDEDNARVKILKECLRPGFAEKAEYAKPVAGGRICGPSIRFAETALRLWGNVLYDHQVVFDGPDARRVKVSVMDMETNTSFSHEIQIPKTVERRDPRDREIIGERTNSMGSKVFIVRATEDEIRTSIAAAVSKALRNEGLRLIPQDIIDEAMEAAAKTRREKDRQDPDSARKKLCDAFAAQGILPKDLKVYLGHDIATLTPAETEDLRQIYTTIKDGEAKWSDYLTPEEPHTPGDDGAAAKAKSRAKALRESMEAQSGGDAAGPAAQ